MLPVASIGRFAAAIEWAVGRPRRAARNGFGCMILCYHGVVARLRDPDLDAYCIDATTLRTHARWFQRHAAVVPLAEILASVRAGRAPDPRWIALTFDDALESQFTLGASILADCGLPWSAAVPSGLIETGRSIWTYEMSFLLHRMWSRPSLPLPDGGVWPTRTAAERRRALAKIQNVLAEQRSMTGLDYVRGLIDEVGASAFRERLAEWRSFTLASWPIIRQAATAGVEMLCHGWSHQSLGPALDVPAWDRELVESRRCLAERINRPVDVFVLPGGDGQSSVASRCQAAGYSVLLTSRPGLIGHGANLLALPRVSAEYSLAVLSRFMGRIARHCGRQPR